MNSGGRARGRVLLWCCQLALAALFAKHGYGAALVPPEQLGLAWTQAVPEPLLRIIGWTELAASAGLVLPAATRILPWLTWVTAAGVALLMVCAIVFHIVGGDEIQHLIPSAVSGAVAAFVAWGRSRWLPIRPRGRLPDSVREVQPDPERRPGPGF